MDRIYGLLTSRPNGFCDRSMLMIVFVERQVNRLWVIPKVVRHTYRRLSEAEELGHCNVEGYSGKFILRRRF